jgi:hypothetical protein
MRARAARAAISGFGIDAISRVAWRLAEELDPRALDARIVLRRFGQLEKAAYRRVEATLQLGIGKLVAVERFMRRCQRKHVGEYTSSQVF